MNFLNVENVSKIYGDKVLFENINLQINEGEKVAIVARNGSGKTTLMRVLAGDEPGEGENASINFKKGIKIGFLKQEPEFREDETILDAIYRSENPTIKIIKEYELALEAGDTQALKEATTKMDDAKAWEMEARIKETLGRFNVSDLNKPVSVLSGGQRKRISLAKQIIEEPDFLILDEPTNHLDVEMIEWLETYLSHPSLTLLMVTHDRYFLEVVCDTILELEKGKLYKHKGNYSQFLERKASREMNEDVVLEKTKKLLKRELEWVRRSPKARTSKSKSRVDSYHNLKESVDGKVKNEKLQIDIKGQRMGSKIVELQYISKAYGDLKLIEEFHYKFKKNEKVGIVGKNGTGKSTFLKMLTKEIRPDAGKVIIGGTIVFGHYNQDGLQLEVDKRVIDVVRDIAEYIPLDKGQKLSAAALLERFLFSRKQQQVYASQLSGGERRRLYLLTILMTNPNFLILDEPTNDLDIISLNILEDFLMEFPGCVVIVSHDRYFMDKVVDHIFVFEGDGKVKDFNGNYTEYKRLKKREQKEASKKKTSTPKASRNPTNESKPKKLSYLEQKEFKKLEKDIMSLETRKSEIMELFNDSSLDGEKIEALSIELGDVNKLISEKEDRWGELAEFI